jgi:5,10-methylenetetrahydrofolate reductase
MVPSHIAARIERAEDAAEEAVVLATEQAVALRTIADGIHVMALGLDAAVPRIVRESGIRP